MTEIPKARLHIDEPPFHSCGTDYFGRLRVKRGRSELKRNRWRQVQFIADDFWNRWKREYLPLTALRQKWPDHTRNFVCGDVVIVANENLPRGRWEMGKVIQTYPDRHKVVRHVDLKTQYGILKRPISKLCLIKESEEIGSNI